MKYSYENLLTIAKGQLDLEDRYMDQFTTQSHAMPSSFNFHHSPFLIDTNMYVMKVWCEFVFGKCHDWILNQIARREYDLYLLCDIDLPWVKDELREYPELEPRQKLFLIYKDLMINQPVPWIHINGGYGQRFVKSVAAVDHLLAAH